MQNVECRIIRHIIGLYSNSAFIIYHSALIIPIILLLLILQVLQRLRFHIDGEVPALVAADRNPIEAHLPAVQVAVDTEVGVGNLVVDEVPTR